MTQKNKNKLERLILEQLPEDEGEKIVKTIADGYIEEGIARGVEQGIEQGVGIGEAQLVKNILNNGVEISSVANLTGLSVSRIRSLSKL